MEKGLELHVKGKFGVPGMSVQGLGFRVFERPFFLRVCGLGFVVTSLLLKGVTFSFKYTFSASKANVQKGNRSSVSCSPKLDKYPVEWEGIWIPYTWSPNR